MTDRPHVTCLMTSSIDGRLHPSCYSESPDGTASDWGKVYEAAHDALNADAWMVGRVTMAEMTKGETHPPADTASPPRPLYRAPAARAPFAVAPDSEGKLHFGKSDVNGNAAIVLLGCGVDDAHLAELIEDGVSYIVSSKARPDLAEMLVTLRRDFGVERVALEGGGGINGAMLAAGLVDELHVLVTPALDGDDCRQGIAIAPDGGFKGKLKLALLGCDARDHGTVLLRYRMA